MTEKRPTLYRKTAGGRWEAVAQYTTQELADRALRRFQDHFSANYTFKLAMAEHRPKQGQYDKRGTWRTSGIQQVSKEYT